MGRHRRSGAVPAADAHAAGTEERRHRGARRKKRGVVPLRTGLLGASAAMAVGAVAVASGWLPGGDTYNTVSGSRTEAGEQIRTEGAPQLRTQGGASSTPSQQPSGSASAAGRTPAASKTPSATPTKPSSTPSKKTEAPQAPKKTKSATPTTKPTPTRTPEKPSEPVSRPVRSASDKASAAEAAVLSLVNAERAKVGCSPVSASAPLGALAADFSRDMAQRDFFDHTDPDGDTPWDRADQAGVQGLGGENIARGQADAAAVMSAWMNSDGHRANILNCDYKTLGVGVHFADGGPWWTQDFGF